MFNPKCYAGHLMVYFEKHRLLEIIRALIIRLCLDRPFSLKHYIRRYFRKIANNVLTKNTIIHLPLEFDVDKFVKAALEAKKIPLITYNTKGKDVKPKDFKKIIHKFEKFCRDNGLQKKNKIYLNMPKNFGEVLQLEKCFSPPTNFIHVNMCDTPTYEFQNVLDFYNCRQQIYPRPEPDKKDLEKSVIPEIMYKIKFSPQRTPFNIQANFKYRTLFIGRQGSGRKTQAKLLASRFNLTYVTIESLVEQTMEAKDNMSRLLCVSYRKERKFSNTAIIPLLWKRLLKNDALANGWVVVGFPKCPGELNVMFTQFDTPPNRVVVLHCSRDICMRRMIKKWERKKMPSSNKLNTVPCVEKSFDEYDMNSKDIYKFLKKSEIKTLHLDGSCSVCYVKNQVFSLLERS